MCFQRFSISGAALAAAALAVSGFGNQRVPPMEKEPPISTMPRLSKAEKLKRFKALAPKPFVALKATSISDDFTLTVDRPVIKNLAALTLHNFVVNRPRYLYDGYATSFFDTGNKEYFGATPIHSPHVTLDFNVRQPNKFHVATFYFYNMVNGTDMKILVDGLLAQTSEVKGGWAQAMVAFKPTKSGNMRLSLLPADTDFRKWLRINFFYVDMDVLK